MCNPLSLLCPPLPPSAFPVPPSAAVMATGVSRATDEPPLIGGFLAGRKGLGCPEMLPGEKDPEDGMGGRQPPELPFPLQPPWPGCREAEGTSGWGCPCALLWAPQPGCAGDRLTPGTRPSTQGHFKGPLMAACSVGKQLRAGPRGAESSVEMLLGRGCCGEKHCRGHRVGSEDSTSPVVCSYLKSPMCRPLPQETVVWGWHWAKWEGQGREGARCPVRIRPAALSEIAWINKHESCWEMRGSGQGQHSSYRCANLGGEEREREKALGLLVPRRICMDGWMEQCQCWGCPAVTQSHSLASAPRVGWVTGQDSRIGSAVSGAVACSQAPELPLCLLPEILRWRYCPDVPHPGWSLGSL